MGVAATSPPTTRQSESRLVSIEQKMANIESIITNQSKSWAQVASPKTSTDPKLIKTRKQKTANHQERAKCEVTLTATAEQTKKQLTKMSYKDITEWIQATINTNVYRNEKPTLLGVIKPTKEGNLRICCENEEEAKMLQQINWETSFEGLQARKPKFGIVIHAVKKDDFNFLIDANKPTIERIEKENTLPIVKIAPPKRFV